MESAWALASVLQNCDHLQDALVAASRLQIKLDLLLLLQKRPI